MSYKTFSVEGLTCAPCTPFKSNGDVNAELIPAYVDHHVDFGMYNVFINGTTGEGHSMTLDERKLAATTWVSASNNRLKVIVHVGGGNLKESIELAQHAQEIGAAAISCVGPTYHKPENIDEYVSYMRQVAAAAPQLPFYLYDIDFFTGISISALEFFKAAMFEIPTMRGLKHTSPHYGSMQTFVDGWSDTVQVLMGTDEAYLEGMAIGVQESIVSSFLGHVFTRMRTAFNKGDMETARKEQSRALKLCNLRKKYKLSIPGGAKAILRVLGLDVGNPRCPLAPVSDTLVKDLAKDMEDIGFFVWGIKK